MTDPSTPPPTRGPEWADFRILPDGARGPRMRSFRSAEGICDRLRAVAFAELQARDGFRWAAARFQDADSDLRAVWRELADEEHKHMTWLLDRLEALGGQRDGREVSDSLWRSLTGASDPEDFAWRMMTAETRGKDAGESLERAIAAHDPETGALFARIAAEEEEHIRSAERFFPGLSAREFALKNSDL